MATTQKWVEERERERKERVRKREKKEETEWIMDTFGGDSIVSTASDALGNEGSVVSIACLIYVSIQSSSLSLQEMVREL